MRPTNLVLVLAALSSGDRVLAQEPPAPERAAVIAAAREVAAQARYCSFITLGEDGQPQARVVDLFPLEEDLTAWIGTRSDTRKVAQIGRDPRATIICFDAQNLAYVTLPGTAELVTDAAHKARHWKPEWKEFYRDENRGEDYVLIRLRPASVEVLSAAHQLFMRGGGIGPFVLKLR